MSSCSGAFVDKKASVKTSDKTSQPPPTLWCITTFPLTLPSSSAATLKAVRAVDSAAEAAWLSLSASANRLPTGTPSGPSKFPGLAIPGLLNMLPRLPLINRAMLFRGVTTAAAPALAAAACGVLKLPGVTGLACEPAAAAAVLDPTAEGVSPGMPDAVRGLRPSGAAPNSSGEQQSVLACRIFRSHVTAAAGMGPRRQPAPTPSPVVVSGSSKSGREM